MKKLTIPLLTTSIILVILLTIGLIYYRIEGIKSAAQINTLEIKNNELKDLLEKYNNGFNINNLTLMVSGPEKVKLGDTVEFNIYFKVNNTKNEIYPDSPRVLIGELIEESADTSNSKILKTMTTFSADNWESKVKLKPEKLGLQILYGVFELPISEDNILSYPIRKEIEVIEK